MVSPWWQGRRAEQKAAAVAGGRGVEQTARATGQGMGAGKVAALCPLPQQ